MNFETCENIFKLLTEMQQNDVIESLTNWASPTVLFRKKDGSTWFCVDYRGLNYMPKKDTF